MKFSKGEIVKTISKSEIIATRVPGVGHYKLFSDMTARVIDTRMILREPRYLLCVDKMKMWWNECLLRKV
jgi:hypothetical protein